MRKNDRTAKHTATQKGVRTFMQLPVWLVKSTLERFSALFTKPGVALQIVKAKK